MKTKIKFDDVSNLDLLINTCSQCKEIIIHGSASQLKWFAYNESNVITFFDCFKCGQRQHRIEKIEGALPYISDGAYI